MKRLFLSFLTLTILFSGCAKEDLTPEVDALYDSISTYTFIDCSDYPILADTENLPFYVALEFTYANGNQNDQSKSNTDHNDESQNDVRLKYHKNICYNGSDISPTSYHWNVTRLHEGVTSHQSGNSSEIFISDIGGWYSAIITATYPSGHTKQFALGFASANASNPPIFIFDNHSTFQECYILPEENPMTVNVMDQHNIPGPVGNTLAGFFLP